MTKSLYFLFLACFLALTAKSQLIINEVSQGTAGAQEYVEFLVYGTPNCTSSCVDIRGWIFDDNNGWHVPGPVGTGQGIADGCMRFSFDTMWSCIPIGTIIVVYNEAEPNPALPPNDPTDANGDCVYILPGNSTFFDRNDTQPNTLGFVPYSGIVFTNGGVMIRTGMRNTGDSYQIIDPNNTTAPYFSIGWGDNTLMQNIYFSGAATGLVMYMTNAVDNNPFNQANWVAASASTNQTPGAPNNPANAAWINSMNNNCQLDPPLVIDTVIPVNVMCSGDCTGSVTVNTSGGTPPYSYLWNDPFSQTANTATGLCAGNYIVAVTDSNNCISLDSVIISSNTLPVVFAGNDVIICTGQCTSLSASGADSYIWTPATGLSDSAVSNPTACPSITTTYIVSGYIDTGTLGGNLILNGDFEAGNVNFNTAYGFGSPSPGFYYVAPNPGVFNSGHSGSDHTSGSGNFLIVDGATTSNTNVWCQTVSVIPNTVYSFSAWVNNIILTSNNFTDPTLQFTINGSPLCGSITLPELPDVWIEVSCTWNSGSDTSAVLCAYSLITASIGNDFGIDDISFTGPTGCSNTDSVTVTVSLPPVVMVNTTDNSCNSSCDGTVVANVAGGTSPFTYSWSNGAGNSSSAGGLCANTYTVIVTDFNTCADTASGIVSQPNALAMVLGSVNASCGNSDGIAFVSASGGIPPYSYQWNDSAMQTADTAVNLPSGTYLLNVTDSSGCISSGVISISDAGGPVAVISAGSNVSCNGGNDGYATVSASGGTPPLSYLWSDTGNQTTLTATGLAASTYSVAVSDSNGCIANANIAITEPPPLLLGTSSVNSLCGSATGSATVAVSGGTGPYSFIWNDTLSQTNNSASGLAAGAYLVKVTDAMGCQDSAYVMVNNTQGPSVLLVTALDVSCNGEDDGSANVSVTGGSPPYTFSWNDPAAQTDSLATVLTAGSYSVIVTDTANCSTFTWVTINEPAIMLLLTGSVDASCGQNNGEASVSVTGGTAPYNYLWNDLGTQTQNAAFGLPAGSYNVTVTDENGCLDIASITINGPLPVILSVSGTPSNCNGACDGTAAVFVSGTTGPYTYLWDVLAGSPPQADSVAASLCPGPYSVTVTDTANCADSISYTISMDASSFTANFTSSDDTVTLMLSTIEFTNLSLPYVDSLLYLWDFGDGFIDSITNPSHTYNDTGTFAIQLIAADNNGCSDTILKYVTIIEGEYILFAPNTFTPNGDGVNDMFFPQGIGIDNNNFKMYIFNRWGDQIYVTADLNKPWDGRANNGAKAAQEDVYVWLILTKEISSSAPHRYVGHVTLVR